MRVVRISSAASEAMCVGPTRWRTYLIHGTATAFGLAALFNPARGWFFR